MFAFWVGHPLSVHQNDFGRNCEKAIEAKIGIKYPIDERDPYCSRDCSWDGLKKLYLFTAVQNES